MSAPRAVVLLSGGLDSATALAVARRDGFACHALSFDYGQRHAAELAAAARVAKALGAVEHKVVRLDLRTIGGSALTDSAIAVPVDGAARDSAEPGTIPVTYVPARNTVFLSIAMGWAEVLGAQDLYLGVNAVDYSGYPDCRPEFIAKFAELARLATRAGVEGGRFEVHAPLMRLHKHEIIALGATLGVDYGMTVSCYQADGDGRACGVCDSCRFRIDGFRQAGLPDPTRYRAG
jgi:7-cyano-7-deazaguanine synthase